MAYYPSKRPNFAADVHGMALKPGYRTTTWSQGPSGSQYRRNQPGFQRSSRWDPMFAEKFGLLRDKTAVADTDPVSTQSWYKKPYWDSDSDGSSDDAGSSTNHGVEEQQFQQHLPPWLSASSPVAAPVYQYGLPPLPPDLLHSLSEEILIFAKWAELRNNEVSERLLVQVELQEVVTQIWPSAKLEVFGSTACGLALPASDLDMVISNVADFDPKFPLPHLVTLAQRLQAKGVVDFSLIPHAKVPLVKYCHPRSHVWVDVTFTAMNSIKCIGVVKAYMQEYPLIRPIVIVLKTLLRQHGLHKPHEGGLGSYALVLLVYCFLRFRAKMMDVQDVANVGALTVDFLRHFANQGTDYAYIPAAKKHAIDASRRVPGCLQILDPLDENNNVAYSCRRVEHIQAIFGIAVESLACYSPQHCPSILGSFISVHDPGLRMPILKQCNNGQGILGDFGTPACGKLDLEDSTSEEGLSESPGESPRDASNADQSSPGL